jgi:hypothetical protein
MKKFLAIAIVAAALTAALADGAGATKPIRNPAGGPPSLTFPAGMVCPFPVFAEAVENRQTATEFSNGDVQVTGFFLTRVTNVLNPDNTLTLVSGGPARLTFGETTFHLTTRGPLIFFFFPGDAGPGDVSTGRTYFFHGRTETEIVTETGAFLSFEYTGKADDLCAALA